MKNLILLFLVIGAVLSATTLTTAASPATMLLPEWTITYVATTGTGYYSFTMTYNQGPTDTNVVTASVATGNVQDRDMGVACVFTTSAFTLATGDVKRGFAFSIGNGGGGTAAAVVTTTNAAWGALALTSYGAATYTVSGTTLTLVYVANTAVSCPVVLTNANLPTLAPTTNIASWTFTVADRCGSLPPLGSVWYAKCYQSTDSLILLNLAAGAAPVLSAGSLKNVTVAAAAATACATTGASTFATGATILAGIAYLQF
jgi:hypothetical protein